MIIHDRKIEPVGDTVRLFAKIECENKNFHVPDTLWFEFPKSYKNALSDNFNSFVVCLLPFAMLCGEDIEIRGKISSHLAYNLREYQRIFNFWCPEKFKLINIKCDKYEKHSQKGNGGVMCSFSGGVDSFYTLWSHLPQNEPNNKYHITHALFVHGFDIPLEDKKTFEIVKKSYMSLGEKMGIRVVPVTTNAKEFNNGDGLEWIITHSSALIGTALMFEKIISHFYFSDDMPNYSLPHFGIHPAIVPLLSTENFKATIHGKTVSKLEKIQSISKWPETYERLRVCWEKPDGLKNCCLCWKCIYTMTFLDMANVLDKYSTFALPRERRNIRKAIFHSENYQRYGLLMQDAKSVGRKDVIFDYTVAVIKSRIRDIIKSANTVV